VQKECIVSNGEVDMFSFVALCNIPVLISVTGRYLDTEQCIRILSTAL
jgi:hypothetical protein